MAEDFVGNKLSVGDEVIYMQLGYRNLVKGVIVKLTDKMCFIKQGKRNIGSEKEIKQFHDQVIKVIKD